MPKLTKEMLTPCAKTGWLEEHNIVYMEFLNIPMDLDMAKKHIYKVENTFAPNGEKIAYISDFRNVRQAISKNVRDYSVSKDATKTCLATAIITSSGLSKALINLVLTFSKPIVPMKMFNNLEDAIKWLKKFQDKKAV